MIKKKLFVFMLVVLSFVALAGCTKQEINTTTTQSLAVSIQIPQENGTIIAQTVSDELTLDKFVVTISKGATVLTKEISAANNSGEVLFENLESGDWNVEVVAKDVEGYDCYAGQTVATVLNGTTVVDIALNLLNGDLDLTVILPVLQGTTVSSGTVRLVNPRAGEGHVEMPLSIVNGQGLADFGSVQAGTWYMEVDLFDPAGNKIAWGSGVMTVLPSRENHAIIEFGGTLEGGELLIRINVNLSPADPTGVNAIYDVNQVVVSWNANPESNISGYTVYRATSETGFKKILTYSLVTDTSYVDTDVVAGETYYYWVQAYNVDGYSSDLSAVAFVDTSVVNTDPVINSITAEKTVLNINESTIVTVDAVDAEGDSLGYSWSATYGIITDNGNGTVTYVAPGTVDLIDTITVVVTDSQGGTVTGSIQLEVSKYDQVITYDPTATDQSFVGQGWEDQTNGLTVFMADRVQFNSTEGTSWIEYTYTDIIDPIYGKTRANLGGSVGDYVNSGAVNHYNANNTPLLITNGQFVGGLVLFDNGVAVHGANSVFLSDIDPSLPHDYELILDGNHMEVYIDEVLRFSGSSEISSTRKSIRVGDGSSDSSTCNLEVHYVEFGSIKL